jgi:predicted phage terminase large subunit-like protein
MRDALSSATNSFVKLWKQSEHNSRKEKNCPEIFIGTRWTKDDIIGEAVDSGKIDIAIKIPALDENGKSFCEAVKSTKEYQTIKSEIENMVWLAEYMQDPTNPEGLLIPFDKLRLIKRESIPDASIIYRISLIDPADKGGDKFSQPFVYVFQHENKLGCFVSDAIHNTNGIEANVIATAEKVQQHRIEKLPIEQNGIGLAAVMLLKNTLPKTCELLPFNSSINKEARILSNFEFIISHFYFDSEQYATNKDYKMFISDLTSYTKEGQNKNKKDAIDALCGISHIIKLKFAKLIYSV